MEQVELYEAGAAAERLGVSASGLRRYAKLYEEHYGDLPRKGKGKDAPRLYPSEVLERLAGAKALVERGRCKGIVEGLEALERGEEPDEAELEVHGVVVDENAARALLFEMRAMRAELSELREEVRGLRALPPVDKVSGEKGGGLLVRLAVRFERWLGRRS
jgi:DNA-binding transcriptional MerR regulator